MTQIKVFFFTIFYTLLISSIDHSVLGCVGREKRKKKEPKTNEIWIGKRNINQFSKSLYNLPEKIYI